MLILKFRRILEKFIYYNNKGFIEDEYIITFSNLVSKIESLRIKNSKEKNLKNKEYLELEKVIEKKTSEYFHKLFIENFITNRKFFSKKNFTEEKIPLIDFRKMNSLKEKKELTYYSVFKLKKNLKIFLYFNNFIEYILRNLSYKITLILNKNKNFTEVEKEIIRNNYLLYIENLNRRINKISKTDIFFDLNEDLRQNLSLFINNFINKKRIEYNNKLTSNNKILEILNFPYELIDEIISYLVEYLFIIEENNGSCTIRARKEIDYSSDKNKKNNYLITKEITHKKFQNKQGKDKTLIEEKVYFNEGSILMEKVFPKEGIRIYEKMLYYP